MFKVTQVSLNHIIVGDWDSERGDQVLIYTHRDAVMATVFVMDGQDYGGGISRYFDIPIKEVHQLLVDAENNYDFYKKIQEKHDARVCQRYE